jgi:hypothetical protein
VAFALVGSVGATSVGAVNTAVTPAYGAGSSRTAGNLLICYISVTGIAAGPNIGTWSQGVNSGTTGTSCGGNIFYKIAAGGDAAPTISAIAGGVISAHLEEWSGNAPSPVRDRNIGAASTTSPVTATMAGADAAAGELVAMAGADFRSVARTPADTWTSNNGTPVLRASNNGVSSVHHYSHATLVTTSNSAADTAVMTTSLTTSLTGMWVGAVSFLAVPTLTPVSGTGAGAGTASTSGGTAAETMTGTGGGTGTAASASGSGTVGAAGATGTGAGTQTTQSASGTGVEAITGSGIGTQVAQSGAGTATLALTGTGAGSQAVQTATGSGSSLVAVTGTGAGTQTAQSASGDGVQVFAGGGNQVPQSAYGEGTVAGGEVEVPPGQGSSLYMPRLRLLIGGTGAGVQAPQSAHGTGMVNDDDLVVMAA